MTRHFVAEVRDAELTSPFFKEDLVGEWFSTIHKNMAIEEHERMEAVRIFSLYLSSQAVFDSVCEHVAIELRPDCKHPLSNGGYTVKVGRETGIFPSKQVISEELSISDDYLDWGNLWTEIEKWRTRRNQLVHRVVSDGPRLLKLSVGDGGYGVNFEKFDRADAIGLSANDLAEIRSVFDRIYHAIAMAEVQINGSFEGQEK